MVSVFLPATSKYEYVQAFKQSQTAWHTAILRLQEAFRNEYRDLLGLGEL
eukprot:COSAG01_NODE_64631_length_276_cov_0.310734_1_plen_49_part_01